MLFGRESASAMVWMLCVLSARFLLLLFRVDSLVPTALLFASPFILQVCRPSCFALYHSDACIINFTLL
jgi:hypothetical protein